MNTKKEKKEYKKIAKVVDSTYKEVMAFIRQKSESKKTQKNNLSFN